MLLKGSFAICVIWSIYRLVQRIIGYKLGNKFFLVKFRTRFKILTFKQVLIAVKIEIKTAFFFKKIMHICIF